MYTFKSGHVSQLEDWGDGGGLNGHNNCLPSSLVRYLKEAGYPFKGTDHEFIAQIRFKVTGYYESSNEGYVLSSDVTTYLNKLGVLVSTSAGDPVQATQPWTLCLVRGRLLFPAQYPSSWFASADVDHFILSLPGGLFNDPLSYYSQGDVEYTSLGNALSGGTCFHLLAPDKIASWVGSSGGYYAVRKTLVPPAVPPKPKVQVASVRLKAEANVRETPQLGAKVIGVAQAGDTIFLQGRPTVESRAEQAAPWYPVEYKGKTAYISHLVVDKVVSVEVPG